MLLVAGWALFGWPTLAFAGPLIVAEAVITTAVADLEPVDAVQSYPAAVGKLFCFTRVVGAQEESVISHVWYRGEAEMGRTVLPVRAAVWRTWSVRTFLPSAAGEWRVAIVDAEGTELLSLPFTLTDQ
ncbi:MAG: DUF2914 domain-containing protein [Desulfuromonadales bacterium]|nr:DUF2914 domain-containing protein [Desulfuromonadales bacterium]